MINPLELESAYQEYITDLKRFAPDGILEVDQALLNELGLHSVQEIDADDLTHEFYVIESAEKLTLFNQKYVIWIVPQMVHITPVTYTLIARHVNGKIRLEIAFSTRGAYNDSHLVLRILEKFLEEIEENEDAICPFTQDPDKK
jgi:hypothetical protein